MTSFLIALAVLIGGYIVYGAIAERIFGIDDQRPTPAYALNDGVDFVPMPTWKVFLIQFLNIAGLGPIFGAIMGIMFGPAAFLWIVFGTIFGGAVHDFISAMMSIREGGASLPEIVGKELGPVIKRVMRAFSIVLLVLVAAVFVITPADLLAGLTPDYLDRIFWIVAIFAYYILATLLPIDKIIGKLYPVFGAALLFMAAGLLGYLLFSGIPINDGFTEGLWSRYQDGAHPVFPMMFVSIACGAISGFHATQSPMMARCLKNERLARPVFYGAMVAEGLVALIWAASTIAFMGSYENLANFMAEHGNSAGAVVKAISMDWLGTLGGILALLGVIAAPITTGDTALRSARLISADMLGFSQKKITRRLLLSIPIFAVTFLLMLIDFGVLWRYFAWSNQTLAVFTLWAATIYLARRHKAYVITLLPAMFMTAVSISYLLFAPRPEGFGVNWFVAVSIGAGTAILLMLYFMARRNSLAPATDMVPEAAVPSHS
jgi:carbon starvation protein CstA